MGARATGKGSGYSWYGWAQTLQLLPANLNSPELVGRPISVVRGQISSDQNFTVCRTTTLLTNEESGGEGVGPWDIPRWRYR